jgi:hypothetical protein
MMEIIAFGVLLLNINVGDGYYCIVAGGWGVHAA